MSENVTISSSDTIGIEKIGINPGPVRKYTEPRES